MREGTPIASVIIPAHNEAAVIGRLLDGLAGLPPTVEVIVVCNGCTDGTAQIARQRDASVPLLVLDLPKPSKTAALNEGDTAASGPCRLYVDADVRVSADTVMAVLAALQQPTVLSARPPIRYDTSGAHPAVRAFYRARTQTTPLMTALWGAGFYGLGPAGRRRWAAFPQDVPDDFFVASLFRPDEIAVVDADPVVVSTPRTIGALLGTLRRVYALPGHPRRSSVSTLAAVVSGAGFSPVRLADAAVYFLLAVAARLPTRGTPSTWHRDETSRQAAMT